MALKGKMGKSEKEREDGGKMNFGDGSVDGDRRWENQGKMNFSLSGDG